MPITPEQARTELARRDSLNAITPEQAQTELNRRGVSRETLPQADLTPQFVNDPAPGAGIRRENIIPLTREQIGPRRFPAPPQQIPETTAGLTEPAFREQIVQGFQARQQPEISPTPQSILEERFAEQPQIGPIREGTRRQAEIGPTDLPLFAHPSQQSEFDLQLRSVLEGLTNIPFATEKFGEPELIAELAGEILPIGLSAKVGGQL